MKRLTLAVVIAALTLGYYATPAAAHVSNKHVIVLIDKRVAHTHVYEIMSGHRITHYWGAANRCHHRGCYALNIVRLRRWTHRDIVARAQLSPWPTYWLPEATCVHSHEGAWTDNTGNGYYGGLQMDGSFERTYGPTFYARWGNASNWPPISQLIAAYRAYLSRGWEPWPNTSAMCGL